MKKTPSSRNSPHRSILCFSLLILMQSTSSHQLSSDAGRNLGVSLPDPNPKQPRGTRLAIWPAICAEFRRKRGNKFIATTAHNDHINIISYHTKPIDISEGNCAEARLASDPPDKREEKLEICSDEKSPRFTFTQTTPRIEISRWPGPADDYDVDLGRQSLHKFVVPCMYSKPSAPCQWQVNYAPSPFWLEDANLQMSPLVALGWAFTRPSSLPITTFNSGKHSTKKHAKTFSYTVTISVTCISGFCFFHKGHSFISH